MDSRAPVAISYRPKEQDYLPVIVAAIRHHVGDWPIALLTEERHLPPKKWIENNEIYTITEWQHSAGANKVLRLWEHQEIFAQHFEKWIWWHDDMLLLRPVLDPAAEFDRPFIAQRQQRRPNKELSNWHGWLWDTLGFFRCLGIYAPNPVLHTPRLIERDYLASIPEQWNRKRLLFEPTYLLWKWHQQGIEPIRAKDYRKRFFKGELPPLNELEDTGYTIINWGRHIDHDKARDRLARHYPVSFT
jgi:hypothetical protein